MKKGKKGMLFAVIMGVLLISTALAYMTSTWIVANSMTVRIRDVNITVYSDDACTKPLTSLSWGEIKQGDRAEKIFWIKNVRKTTYSWQHHFPPYLKYLAQALVQRVTQSTLVFNPIIL